jgi:hypothetical protein
MNKFRSSALVVLDALWTHLDIFTAALLEAALREYGIPED